MTKPRMPARRQTKGRKYNRRDILNGWIFEKGDEVRQRSSFVNTHKRQVEWLLGECEGTADFRTENLENQLIVVNRKIRQVYPDVYGAPFLSPNQPESASGCLKSSPSSILRGGSIERGSPEKRKRESTPTANSPSVKRRSFSPNPSGLNSSAESSYEYIQTINYGHREVQLGHKYPPIDQLKYPWLNEACLAGIKEQFSTAIEYEAARCLLMLRAPDGITPWAIWFFNDRFDRRKGMHDNEPVEVPRLIIALLKVIANAHGPFGVLIIERVPELFVWSYGRDKTSGLVTQLLVHPMGRCEETVLVTVTPHFPSLEAIASGKPSPHLDILLNLHAIAANWDAARAEPMSWSSKYAVPLSDADKAWLDGYDMGKSYSNEAHQRQVKFYKARVSALESSIKKLQEDLSSARADSLLNRAQRPKRLGL